MTIRLVAASAALCLVMGLLLGCVGGPEPERGRVSAERLLSSFENDEEMVGWTAGSEVTMERSREHATEGNQALRVALPGNGLAGVECQLGEGDWSGYTSLRMDVVYPYDDRLVLAVRVDDADSSDYASRFNLDDGSVTLTPGRNVIEISMRELASGRPGSRGLDLTRIRSLHLFPLGDQPERSIFLDNVRLEALDVRAVPSPAVIDGFEEAGRMEAWQVSEGVQVAPSTEQVTEGERSLRVRLPGGPWPGISLFALPRNWLPYDWLLVDVYNDTDDTMMLGVWVRDGVSKLTVATVLRPGANRIQIPVDLFSPLRLRTVTGLCIFVSQPAPDTVLYVDNIRLERWPLAAGADATAPSASVLLDYSSLASVARNTPFLANVYPKGSGEGRRVVRLRPVDRDLTRYAVAVAPGSLVVSSFFLDHDTWFFNTRTVEVPGPETTVRYEPGDFAH